MQPENLYIELRDMAAVSFLMYTFAYILDVARKESLKGLDVSEGGQMNKMAGRDLVRSFTPKELLTIIEDNLDVLKEKFSEFGEEHSREMLMENLKTMQERADASGLERPLTLEEYDDYHQEQELVYGVAKDAVNKRITLAFRGTENAFAAKSNWSTNLNALKEKVIVPDVLKEVIPNELYLHKGFYNYVFAKTKDETDDAEFTKRDEIWQDIKRLLKEYPDYKLYVTGHSLGGALSTMVAFYLACDPEMPKPVTCINFAAPRIGNWVFLDGVKWLEEQKYLRMLRVVNDQDSIASAPIVNYKHVGIQARLYSDDKAPELSYPKTEDTYKNFFYRIWMNSAMRSLNFKYDHGEYRERVWKDKEFFEKLDLDSLYKDKDLTGFSSASSE